METTMKKDRPVLFALLLLFLISSTFGLSNPARTAKASSAASSVAAPTLLKRTVFISSKRFLVYWPNPKAAEPKYNTWSWTPQVEFELLGPIAGGSQFVFEVTTPDGKPWVSFKLQTPEAGDDEVVKIKGPDLDTSELEKMAITQTGLFPFKIMLKNALAGTNDVFFSGKFKVATYPPDQAIPDYKGKAEFYVVQDWRLPMGLVWYDPRMDENVPTIAVQAWFKGTSSGQKLEAVMFHKGQQIGTVLGNNESEISTGVGDPQGRWGLWTFSFPKVRGLNEGGDVARYPDAFFLNKNPGDYEVKILQQQKLARTGSFNVGTDGRIVDNGIAKENKLGGIRMILPLKILGDQDVSYDPLSWKTDMFYGNGLTGFTAP
jgi:hypothetical protein